MKGSICLAIVLQLALLILLGSKSQRSVAQSSGGAYVTEKVAHRTAKIVSSATPGVKPATYVKVKEGVHKIAGKLGIKKPPSSIELHYQDRGGANAAPSRSP